MLEYFSGDERPAWVATVSVNGTTDDMTSGYTFEAKVHPPDVPTDLRLTKTTNITGGPGGRVTVTWIANDLAIVVAVPTVFYVQLKASRTADNAEWTITEPLLIKPRA